MFPIVLAYIQSIIERVLRRSQKIDISSLENGYFATLCLTRSALSRSALSRSAFWRSALSRRALSCHMEILIKTPVYGIPK